MQCFEFLFMSQVENRFYFIRSVRRPTVGLRWGKQRIMLHHYYGLGLKGMRNKKNYLENRLPKPYLRKKISMQPNTWVEGKNLSDRVKIELLRDNFEKYFSTCLQENIPPPFPTLLLSRVLNLSWQKILTGGLRGPSRKLVIFGCIIAPWIALNCHIRIFIGFQHNKLTVSSFLGYLETNCLLMASFYQGKWVITYKIRTTRQKSKWVSRGPE